MKQREEMKKKLCWYLQICCKIAFFSIAIFWGSKAYVKLKYNNISTLVQYKWGDDNHGNIEIPIISICPSFFPRKFHSAFKLESTNLIDFLGDASKSSQILTYNDSFKLIQWKIENFVQVMFINENIILSELFEPLLHWEFGFCYTFQSRQKFANLQSATEKMSFGIVFHFDFDELVSFYGETPPPIQVILHKDLAINDAADALYKKAMIEIGPKEFKVVSAEKISIETINTELKPCSIHGGYMTCLNNKVMKLIQDKFKCSLPFDGINEFNNNDGELCDFKSSNWSELKRYYKCHYHYDKDYNQCEMLQTCPNLVACSNVIYKLAPKEQRVEKDSDFNAAGLAIVFESDFFVNVQDTVTYDLQSLIGEIGGTLGLFLGFSFISIFQFVDTIRLFN